MEGLIKDTTALVFDLKGEIAEGHYLKLMNNLNDMYKLKDQFVKPERVARTIPEIINAWIENKKGATYTGSLSTNDGNLFSYALQIGYTRQDGTKCIVDHTARGLGFVSQTTSTHVGKCVSYCDANNVTYILTLAA